MPMDFPGSPINGQTTTDGRYYFDSSVGSSGAWRSTPLPVGGLPAGSIMAWGTNTPPANWLLADGSAVSRATYSSLFAVIGTQYGAGDGTTTFNLPDLRGRVPVGRNGGTFGTLGASGGAETHTLTINEMPSHKHGRDYVYYQVNSNIASPYPAAGDITSGQSGLKNLDTGLTGGGAAHNNLQPYQVVNYIIKFSAGWTAGDSELATRLGVVETANATTNRSGLVPIIPSAVSVGSGTASVSTAGVVTFSGAYYIQLSSVFSSLYKNYRIVYNVDSMTGSGAIHARLGEVTNTSGHYHGGFQLNHVGTASYPYGGNIAHWELGYAHVNVQQAVGALDVFSPNRTVRTAMYSTFTGGDSSDYAAFRNIGGVQTSTSSFSAFTLIGNNGTVNIGGTIQVYGYR